MRGLKYTPSFLYIMFKRDLSAYLITATGTRHNLPVYPDISYSQVYTEEELPQKTLHNPENLISGGITTGLNPGNFSFTVPVFYSTVFSELFSLFFTNTPVSSTIVLETPNSLLQLDKFVVDNIVFNFNKDALITASISGTYSDSKPVESIIGQELVNTERKFTWIGGLGVFLNTLELPYITGFSLEMRNNVSWLDNRYMQDETIKPKESFYTSDKTLSGTITQNSDLTIPTFQDDASFRALIRSEDEDVLDINFNKVIITSRPELSEVIKTGYDFRVTGNINTILYKGVNII